MKLDKTPFSQRTIGQKLIAVAVAIPFLGGGGLVIFASRAFFLPMHERGKLALIGAALFGVSIAAAFAITWLRSYRIDR